MRISTSIRFIVALMFFKGIDCSSPSSARRFSRFSTRVLFSPTNRSQALPLGHRGRGVPLCRHERVVIAPDFIRGDSIAYGCKLVDLVPSQSQSDWSYVFPRSIARSLFVQDFVVSPMYAQSHDIISASTNFARHLIHASIDLSKHILK